MRLTAIATKPNLQLAWRRITTGSNHQYKRYFRHLYHAYELALEENLKDLRARLLSRAWQPHAADRVYLPKASGLQRPLTLLHLEDQIVLQAIANIIASRVAPARKPFLYKAVFSNVVQSPKSIFFFRSWRRTYTAFTSKVDEHYGSGREWVADFDLAAFYETISHELLLRTAYPRLGDSDDVRWIRACLSTWTSETFSNSMGHGLPQGPIASDLLAEVFLLPVDKAMQSFPGYIRYVDDMRLFGRTEAEIRRAVLALEINCRNRGLIPQVGKFAVKRAQSVAEARGMLPSVGSARDSTTPRLSASKAERLVRRAVGGRPLRVVDKSRLRYVMYRADTSPRLLRLACLLISRHPEHIDAFAVFLGRYEYRKSIRDCCLELLAKTPYPYVAGEMWHLLSQYYAEPMAFSAQTRRRLTEQAMGVLRARQADIAVKWGAAHFVCAAERRDHRSRTRYLRNQSAVLQGIIGPALPDAALTTGGVIRQFLTSSDFEPGLGIASSMHAARVTPASVGIRASQLRPQLANTLRRLGLIRSRRRQVDVLGEILDARYGTASRGQWRKLLGAEYTHAAGILIQADAAFGASPSYWLSHQNSFNQTIFLALQRYLLKSGAAGVVTTTNTLGQLVDYGVTLDKQNAFSKAHPSIADAFRSMNTRRNKLPASHPYEKKSAAQTKYLTAQERNKLVAILRAAYADLLVLSPQ